MECQLEHTGNATFPTSGLHRAHHMPTEVQSQIQENPCGLDETEAGHAPDRDNCDAEFPESSPSGDEPVVGKQPCANIQTSEPAAVHRECTSASRKLAVGSAGKGEVLQEIQLAGVPQLPSLACNYVSESEEPVRPATLVERY
jgi:hypothetical protein